MKHALYKKFATPLNPANAESAVTSAVLSDALAKTAYYQQFAHNARLAAKQKAQEKAQAQAETDEQMQAQHGDEVQAQAPVDLLAPALPAPLGEDLAQAAEAYEVVQQAGKESSGGVAIVPEPVTSMGALIGGLLFLGATLGDNGDGTAAHSDDCDHSFPFPNRPTASNGDLVITAQVDEDIVQPDGEPATLEAGASLIVTAAANSNLNGETSSFAVEAASAIGDVYVFTSANARVFLSLDVSGAVGDISVHYGPDTQGDGELDVVTQGDVGVVTVEMVGAEAGGKVHVDAFGGNVEALNLQFTNADSNGSASISAYAEDVSGELVGGNVGDVTMFLNAAESQGSGWVRASGGDVGNVLMTACNGSASGQLNISALAMMDGASAAVGGNVGDITVRVHGASGDAELDIHVSGVLDSSDQYLGGGQVGNIFVQSVGTDAGLNVEVYAYSGGTVGNITMQVSTEGSNEQNEPSANVSASAWGASGQIASIGDVSMEIYGPNESSGGVYLYAYDGDIGNINSISHVMVSGQFDIFASAFASGGSGGNIGNITLVDTSYGGDHVVRLRADTSIGDLSFELGDGSAQLAVDIEASSGATVGDITITFGDEQYGWGQGVDLAAGSGATVGTITVIGGREIGNFYVMADGSAGEGSVGGTVIGDVDMSQYLGEGRIELYAAENGVRIDASQGGSEITGTEGIDEIYLGAGSDTLKFWANDDGEGVDNIYDFEVGLDVLDTLGSGFTALSEDAPTLIDDGDVVALIDEAGGDDIMDIDGLLDALNGGEYDGVDTAGGTFAFATATADSAESFNLYRVVNDGSTYTGYLMAVVNLAEGSTFGGLSSSDFGLDL